MDGHQGQNVPETDHVQSSDWAAWTNDPGLCWNETAESKPTNGEDGDMSEVLDGLIRNGINEKFGAYFQLKSKPFHPRNLINYSIKHYGRLTEQSCSKN